MRQGWMAAAAALSLAAAVASAQQPAGPAQTIQQQFDAASAALEAENWDEALRILEALEARVADNARSLAVVRVRKGQALFRLSRHDEALAAIRAGLAQLSADDPSLAEDRFRSFLTLGRDAELRLDYREASESYRAAAAIAVDPALKLALYRGLIQTSMFHDALAALGFADEALSLLAATAPRERDLEGQFRTARGRVLLNMGRYREARAELDRATRRLGGLGLRVDLRDLIARSDLAIAAMLDRDPAAARRFLALTGAGTMREASPPLPSRAPLPRCGGDLSPEDVAVVELLIRDDGSVGAAIPVYASTQGDSGVRFARAVRLWSWLPEQVRPIEPIFRNAVRIELRCTLAPRQDTDIAPHLAEETGRWAAARGIAIELLPARNRTIAEMRADLTTAEAQHDRASPHLLRPLMRLGDRSDLQPRERAALLARALPIARAADAPGSYLAEIALALAEVRREAAGGAPELVPDYLALLREFGMESNGDAAAALHLAAARRLYLAGRFDEAAAMTAQLQTVAGYGPDHPLRREAADLSAMLATARGDAAGAEAAWRSVPAGTYTCALRPQLRAGSGGSSDFPNEALAWGFEGWTRGEMQVGTEGTPLAIRTTTAYPPFVFDAASERIMQRFRFAPAFAPEGRPCATWLQRVVYRLPR